MTELSMLYQTNYSAWASKNADLLRAGRYAELDVEHLLEELSDMSKSEQRELENRLTILLAHVLKWEYQYSALSDRWREFYASNWRARLIEERTLLARLFKKSPGLKSLLTETIIDAYADAMQLASDETDLPLDTFPAQCPYSAEQLFDKLYYPDFRA